jgi:tetratricopeptide (TPR) repeat protein
MSFSSQVQYGPFGRTRYQGPILSFLTFPSFILYSKKMLKRLLFALLALLFIPAFSGFKYIPQGATEEILQEAKEGQVLIFNRRYAEAQKHFTNLAFKYPDSPLGSFGLMALYNAKMFENLDFALDSAFLQEQARNHEIVEKIVKQDNASAWDYFLCGASSGLSGFYYMRRDKALTALGEAQRAKKCLEKAYQKDPGFHDVNLGLGMYDYWRSVFTNNIKILPFFKDKRQEGIQEIQKAIDEGTIANDLSRVALMFVYQQERNSQAGLPIAEQLHRDYPPSIIVMNNMGEMFSRLGRHQEAQSTYDEILRMDPKITVAYYFKGIDYFRMGKLKEAKENLEQFLQSKPTPAWQAYAHYDLGKIALQEGQREVAIEHFTAGYKAYSHESSNLKMILQMRKETK